MNNMNKFKLITTNWLVTNRNDNIELQNNLKSL